MALTVTMMRLSQQQKNMLMRMIKQHVSVTICPPVYCVSLLLSQVGGGEDMQLVVDKAATQLRCLLQQLVTLVKQDQPVQSEKLVAK